MSDLFTKLMDRQADQEKQVNEVELVEQKAEKKNSDDVAQKSAQKNERMSKPLSKGLSEPSNPVVKTIEFPLKAEDIELMTFQLRKQHKSKVNTEIVDDWKGQLDALAFSLKIGKYELLEFIIGAFLGEVEQKK